MRMSLMAHSVIMHELEFRYRGVTVIGRLPDLNMLIQPLWHMLSFQSLHLTSRDVEVEYTHISDKVIPHYHYCNVAQLVLPR